MSKSTIIAALIAGAASLPAHAQTEENRDRFFLRGGPAFATFDATAKVDVAGKSVPGADASVNNNTGVAIEGGWFFLPDWSVSLTVGIPPTARIHGEGTLSSAGLLGSVSYGPSVLGVQYNVPTGGRFRPYIGAGYNYTLIYHVRGSAIRDLRVSDGNGPVAQAGAEYRVNSHMSVFADVKKIWIAVDANGLIDTPAGSLPAHARAELNPVIANAGVSWHF